tara:strand:- start:346 stop:462 length:117 start_codon:yes stop_codon:yes gene_type:complete
MCFLQNYYSIAANVYLKTQLRPTAKTVALVMFIEQGLF